MVMACILLMLECITDLLRLQPGRNCLHNKSKQRVESIIDPNGNTGMLQDGIIHSGLKK